MFEIVAKRMPTEGVKDIEVHAPIIAKKRKAGQFILLQVDDDGERIPLTIVDSDPERGIIRLIFQEVGKTTEQLGTLNVGDHLAHVVGPLGSPTHIEKFGNTVCIGGGIGVAPVHPIAQALKNSGNNVTSIIGSRNKDLLILEEEMRATSDKLIITTDDGSYGFHGFVTQALQQMIDDGEKIDLVVGIGPVVMMRAVAEVTRQHKIPTFVSLNPIMVDGTGMCGGCRVSVGGEVKFACVDGPEFDGHQVDFEGLMQRQKAYLAMEKKSLDRYHKCKMEAAAEKA
jgi:ferredoxin/flavodoxin---NADP+ reductase